MTSAAGREAPQETFSGGFSKDFAHNLPTQEFMGDFASMNSQQLGLEVDASVRARLFWLRSL